MNIVRSAIAALCVAFTVSACAAAKEPPAPAGPVAAPETARVIAQGAVRGFVAANGTHAFLALPFAAAPEGELRFRAPRPAPAWSGVREALTPAPRCAQLSNRLDAGKGIEPGLVIGSEDCLKLSVYAPAFAPSAIPAGDARLPVMVWIHGGSNVWGAAEDYDGSILAKSGNVIVVTLQYRVGALGFMAHEALRADARDERDRSANFATLDLIAGLEWVRDNIAAFGGNPGNVTVFGESAGGQNVMSLLVSPRAGGLFHKAIVQSGLLSSVPLAEAEGVSGKAVNSARQIVEKLGLKPGEIAAGLRKVDLRTLFYAVRDPETGYVELPRVIADGIVIPEQGIVAALSDPASRPTVPLILGTNRDELKLFQMLDSRLVKKSFGLFPTPRDPGFYDGLADAQSRMWRALVVDDVATTLGNAGQKDVWSYRFDWDDQGKIGLADFKVLLGAGHAVEIPFIFGRWAFFGPADKAVFTAENEAGRLALSRAMMAYWTEFARTGRPGTGGTPDLPEWRIFGEQPSAPQSLIFDSAGDGGVRMVASRDTVEGVIAAVKADPRLDHPKQSCLVLGAITQTTPEIADRVRALTPPECGKG